MLNKNQNTHLSQLIAERYESPNELAQHLEMGIEMLFYLEENAFDKREVQNVAYALKGVSEALRQAEVL